ncbi:MAG: PHP domain-containing protein [Chitinivibrionales bacterium]|nr:PHP domain-containing protein [Chitinivibrionales bacterium]
MSNTKINKPINTFQEICGALHLHTQFSDGGVDIPELISAAQEVGLDYLVVTDHMSLQAKNEGFEGFNDGVSLVVGYEHQDIHNRNHYLVIGSDTIAAEKENVQGYIDEIKRSGGIGFIAHPAEKRHYFQGLPSYPWTEWSAGGYDGIEIWNQMSDWVEHLKNWQSFIRILFPRRLMADVPVELLKKWDELNRSRFVAAVGGVDAHTRRYGLGLVHLTIFPVKVELKGIRTHLYLNRPYPARNDDTTKKMIIGALKNGHSYVSNYRRGDARGSRFFVHYDDGSFYCPGIQPEIPGRPVSFEASVPEKAEIRLLRNGEVCAFHKGRRANFPVSEKGVYRIEVRKKNYAWIYTNPFPLCTYPVP